VVTQEALLEGLHGRKEEQIEQLAALKSGIKASFEEWHAKGWVLHVSPAVTCAEHSVCSCQL
jgi:hypothetical protein